MIFQVNIAARPADNKQYLITTESQKKETKNQIRRRSITTIIRHNKQLLNSSSITLGCV